tara:strand:+ start:558 stop:2102 length:1545 start_codon:yes stop_codon:yes gene_type:complete
LIFKKIYLQSLYIFFIGVFVSFSLPPYNLWIINFFAFSLLFIILVRNNDKNLKVFFFYGYSFGFGYFLSNLYWIPFSLSYDDNFKSYIPIAIVIIPAFLSLFYAFAFSLFKFFFNEKNIFVSILIFSISVSFFEFLRGNILSGFPWNLFAHSLSENINLIQINSLIGVYAFNMILISIFSSPSILLLNRNKQNLIGFFVILSTFVFFYLFGIFKIKSFNNLEAQILSNKIKIISTNIPIERYYSNIDDEEILIKLIDLSNPNLEKNTIFIWPEGIIPNINLEELRYEYSYLFEKFFSKNHTIILGINDEEISNESVNYYNSLSIIDNKTNILYKYYKNKLVPFGEFLPLENLLSKLGLKSLTNNYQSYSASKQRKLYSFKEDEDIKILPLICYEIIYSGSLSKEIDYNFIINISEDGWFGNSVGPSQHFVHAIFRSIENGKYTLRSANNGISAIINPIGLVTDKIETNTEGTILLTEIKEFDKTLFSKYGNKIYFLLILIYIFLIFSFTKLKNE